MLKLYRWICCMWDGFAHEQRRGTRTAICVAAVLLWMTATVIQIVKLT